MSELPQWYIDESIPRLKRMDELSPKCAFDKWPSEKTIEEKQAFNEWYKLMVEQSEAEIKAGL